MSSLRKSCPAAADADLPTAGISRTQLAALVFGALAALYLYWLVWRAFLPCEINGNEAWNAWHARIALQGGPLYPDRDDLFVNNYPPLSFYFVGLVSILTGDAIYTGRMISLISTAAIAFSLRLKS